VRSDWGLVVYGPSLIGEGGKKKKELRIPFNVDFGEGRLNLEFC
jgi:hypothetical protein